MSITAELVPQVQEKNYKKSLHQIRHNDSGELDVFEASRYFSGASEISGSNFTQQKIMRSGGRISLDIPMMSNSTSRSSIPAQTPHHRHHLHELEKATKENNNTKKKYKQPNSPGGRLASFLNSLFSSQISSKKKKSSKSSSSTQSVKAEDESPSGRRKRRSSISHFPSVSTMNSNSSDSKSSIYSSSSSGFRTPPPYSNSTAPKKKSSYKDLRSYSDHKPVVMSTNLSKNNGHVKFTTSTNGFSSSSEKFKTFGNGLLDHNTALEERDQYIKFINEVDNIDDDGADSDSSSDLFELPNYDFSGLPVYETTHMDSIKRGVPITSTGAI